MSNRKASRLFLVFIVIGYASVGSVLLSFHKIVLSRDDANMGIHQLSIMPASPANEAPSNPEGALKQSVQHQIIQSFVVSFKSGSVEAFRRRNQQSGLANATWFPAMNGFDQRVLDEFAQLTGFPGVNASRFLPKSRDKKMGYNHPHHTGCFMSHWNLLRLAKESWASLGTAPDVLVILEDDASCVDQALQHTLETIAALPASWDMLFIGGKPFTYYDNAHTSMLPKELRHNTRDLRMDLKDEKFRQLACDGAFGPSATGPFAPDGTRQLSIQQKYWQTRYTTNTHAYVVNPASIHKLLLLLEKKPIHNYQVPVDIAYADAMRAGVLNVYMPTTEYCFQGDWKKNENHASVRQWKGLYIANGYTSFRSNDMLFPECPNKA